MKTLKMSVWLAAILVSACQTNRKDNTIEEPAVAVEETTVEVPNPSDIAFDEALQSFEEKDYKGAADQIGLAIEDLKTETAGLDSTVNITLNDNIMVLDNIREMLLKDPGNESEDYLALAFDDAEFAIAHEYFTLADYYVINMPSKSKSYLKQGLKHMKHRKRG